MSTPDQHTAIATKVLKLCRGNHRTALNLLAETRAQFPRKSELWALSKLLWDLEHGAHSTDPNDYRYIPPRQYSHSDPFEPLKEIQKQATKETRPADMWLSPELVSLCGNENTAVRLVQQIRDRNLGCDWEWCNEKAIHDLERDRH